MPSFQSLFSFSDRQRDGGGRDVAEEFRQSLLSHGRGDNDVRYAIPPKRCLFQSNIKGSCHRY